jgi:hypothetical protein
MSLSNNEYNILYNKLYLENQTLFIYLNNILKSNDILKQNNISLTQHFIQLTEYIQHTNLTIEDIDELKSENLKLKIKINELEQNILDQTCNYNQRISTLENTLLELKSKDESITAREGITALEKHIMLDIIGSKKRIRRYFGIQQLFEDENYFYECQKYLDEHNITKEHIYLIASLKKSGNRCVHQNRPLVNRKDWNNLLVSMLDDPNDFEDINMVHDLLKLFEKYIPPPVSDNDGWQIIHP